MLGVKAEKLKMWIRKMGERMMEKENGEGRWKEGEREGPFYA